MYGRTWVLAVTPRWRRPDMLQRFVCDKRFKIFEKCETNMCQPIGTKPKDGKVTEVTDNTQRNALGIADNVPLKRQS